MSHSCWHSRTCASFPSTRGSGHVPTHHLACARHAHLAGASAGALADYYFDEEGRYAAHAGLSAGVTTGLLDTGVAGVEGGAIVTLDVGLSLGITKFMTLIAFSVRP